MALYCETQLKKPANPPKSGDYRHNVHEQSKPLYLSRHGEFLRFAGSNDSDDFPKQR